mgnify:CR=1 FL=1
MLKQCRTDSLAPSAGPKVDVACHAGLRTKVWPTSQNGAQQPDNCNMVTWSVLKENNTHIAKRALEASTDARSPECTEEPAHFCTIEMHSSHTISLHCYAEHALHCRDCDPMISIIANYTLTLETLIFRVQSQVIVRMNPSAPA